jgi:hypothetical protein
MSFALGLSARASAKAPVDEPIFVLLARDEFAPQLVRQWAMLRSITAGGMESGELLEALACAREMEKWRIANLPESDALKMVDPT